MKMTGKRKKVWIAAAAVLLALAIGCGMYVSDYYRADETAAGAMAGSEAVTVRQLGNMAVFTPEDPIAGFIFYPGGKVEHTAYAPLMLALAERDVLCVLVEMPCNLAVLDMNAAEGIPEQFPEVGNWYIGGHSLGGSMAAGFAADNAGDFRGLVLLAAYSTADLADTNLAVVSLYGSEDGVLNMEKYESYHENLPGGTFEMVIEGGNHAGFGSYGAQEGDGEAAISTAEQVKITADAIIGVVRSE